MADTILRSTEKFVGTEISHAYAVKAGPWIFLTGHEPFDFGKGLDPRVEGPSGFASYGAPRLRREADYVVHRMRAILKEFGTDFGHSLRIDQYYPTPRAVTAYHLTRKAEFGDYIPPSTSVIMDRCLSAGSHISMSMIATVPDKDWKIERIYPKEVPVPVGSGFVPAISCNDFVFVAGQMASGEEDLDPSVVIPKHRHWGGPSAIRRQAEFVIKSRLEPALKAAGSLLEHSVKAQAYLTSAEDIPEFIEVWNRHFQTIPCALTVVPTTALAQIEGVIEINLLALRGNARRKKEVLSVDIPAMATFGPCIRVGELVLPSGLMAIDTSGYVAGAAQSDTFRGLCHSGQVQASQVFAYAENVCKAAGTTMRNVVRAQYFVTDVSEFPGIALAWLSRYGNQPHPFVCVQCPGPLPAPSAVVVADFWIYAP